MQKKYLSGFWNLVYVDSLIMLLLSITSAGKNILYNIYLQEGYHLLAPLQYICNYLFGPLTLLCVDWLIEKFNYKVIFYISSFNLNLFLIGGMIVSSCSDQQYFICDSWLVQFITVITSLIAGILQTIFYVTFVTFINYLSNDKNKELFYGISFSFTSLSNIFANVIGYFLNQQVSWFYFYLIILLTSAIIQLGFFFTKDDRKLSRPKTQFCQELSFQLRSLYNQLVAYKYIRFLGVLLFAGLMNSVIYLFIPILISKNGYSDDEISSYIYIGFFITGIGQVIGGVSSGKMSEKFRENRVLYFTFIINVLGILCAQIGNINQNNLIYAGCFLLGLSDSAISSLALIVITKQISTSNHAFAGYNLCQSLGFGLASLWWAIFNSEAMIYDIGFLYGTSMLTAISLFYYTRLKVQQLVIE